jgi:hypothetical protein
MYECYYLLVWCEDSDAWHQADECEARSLRKAMAILFGRNPRLALRGNARVVHQDDLAEALARKPSMDSLSREFRLAIA